MLAHTDFLSRLDQSSPGAVADWLSEQDFNEGRRRFAIAHYRTASVEARWNDAAVIEYQQISWVKV
jgi:hypothetical protein